MPHIGDKPDEGDARCSESPSHSKVARTGSGIHSGCANNKDVEDDCKNRHTIPLPFTCNRLVVGGVVVPLVDTEFVELDEPLPDGVTYTPLTDWTQKVFYNSLRHLKSMRYDSGRFKLAYLYKMQTWMKIQSALDAAVAQGIRHKRNVYRVDKSGAPIGQSYVADVELDGIPVKLIGKGKRLNGVFVFYAFCVCSLYLIMYGSLFCVMRV